MRYRIRKATEDDRPSLTALIARSARELSAGDYTPEQVEGALAGAFGIDTQLMLDGTYFVVEDEGAIAGCGGWSYRKTLFGGDAHTQRDAAELDPRIDAAKIRAFFIDPAHARKGAGRALLEHCEAAARERGFSRCELMATLPGLKLYRACGYVAGSPVQHPIAPGLTIEFVPMSKQLAQPFDSNIAESYFMPTGGAIRTRPATLDDATGIAQVHVAAWQHAYRSILPADFLARLSVEKRTTMWRESIEKNLPNVVVADAGGMVVGFSAFGPCRDEGSPPDAFEIWALYLLPEYWSRGVGRALWLASRESLIKQGAHSVSLWVIAGNERAIRFYRMAGFEPEAASLKSFEIGGIQVEEIRCVLRLTETSQ